MIRGVSDVQCYGQCIGLELFDTFNFKCLFVVRVLLVTTVPMNIFVLLPTASWGIDTVAKVVLGQK